MAKARVRPSPPIRSASMSRRSTRTQKEWKVESCGLASVEPASSLSTRSPISAEALLVKVTARMESGATPFASIRYAMRCVMTRVLPEPAPARMSTGPSVASTAVRCCGFIFCRRGFMGRGWLGCRHSNMERSGVSSSVSLRSIVTEVSPETAQAKPEPRPIRLSSNRCPRMCAELLEHHCGSFFLSYLGARTGRPHLRRKSAWPIHTGCAEAAKMF